MVDLFPFLRPLNDYMASAAGQATATWLSAILSLAAIVIALGVALVEQRRFHAERLREAEQGRKEERRREEHALKELIQYVGMCKATVDGAIESLDAEIQRIEIEGGRYTEWRDVSSRIAPEFEALRALQRNWQGDAAVVMNLSYGLWALGEVVNPPANAGIGTSPPKSIALRHLSAMRSELAFRSKSLETEMRTKLYLHRQRSEPEQAELDPASQ